MGSYPTFSPLPPASPESHAPEAVSFLCHFPSAFAAWGFPSVLPFGVRTFLEPRGSRSPGLQENCNPEKGPREYLAEVGDGSDTDSDRARRPSRVAIADDSRALRVLVRALIQLEPDFELVGEAANGSEAISLAERERPDVLVLDLAMPELDGLQVLEHLRATCPEVTVVVYSGYGASTLRETVLELGAADCIEKGVPPDEFVERLRRAATGTAERVES